MKTEFLNRNRLSVFQFDDEIKSPSEKVDPSDVLIDGRPLESIELDGVLNFISQTEKLRLLERKRGRK